MESERHQITLNTGLRKRCAALRLNLPADCNFSLIFVHRAGTCRELPIYESPTENGTFRWWLSVQAIRIARRPASCAKLIIHIHKFHMRPQSQVDLRTFVHPGSSGANPGVGQPRTRVHACKYTQTSRFWSYINK